MKGSYILYYNGSESGPFENVITTEGMHIIRTYLAGGVSDWAGAIAVGASNTSAPSSTDSSLGFEFARVPVLLKSVDGSEIVVSGTIPEEVNGQIYELGIYPALGDEDAGGFNDRLIVDFSETWLDDSEAELSSSSFSTSSRIGNRSFIIDSTEIYGKAYVDIDLIGYSSLDTLSLFYNVTSTGADRDIKITFQDDQLPTPGTKSGDITITGSSTGYKTITTELGNLTESNFNGSVSSIIIESSAASGCEFDLDAIRINDADETNPVYALVSRSIISSSPGATDSSAYFTKNPGVQVDIEYRLSIGS